MTQKTIERTATMSGRLRCAGLPRREDSTACIAERRSKMQLFVRTGMQWTFTLLPVPVLSCSSIFVLTAPSSLCLQTRLTQLSFVPMTQFKM